jgi:hypothetical protein
MHAMRCGAYAPQGTPEQSALIQHRSWVLRVVWLVFMGTVFAGLLIPHALGLHPSRTAVRVFGIGYFLCGALALVVFTVSTAIRSFVTNPAASGNGARVPQARAVPEPQL